MDMGGSSGMAPRLQALNKFEAEQMAEKTNGHVPVAKWYHHLNFINPFQKYNPSHKLPTVLNGMVQDYPAVSRNIFGTFNDCCYQIPFVNLFWTFLDGAAEVPGWGQISAMLETMSITNALVLALVCTFYCACDYTEMLAVDLRYGVGDWQAAAAEMRTQAWIEGTPLTHPRPTWKIKYWDGPPANVYTSTSDPDAGWKVFECEIPCFQDRPIDGDGTMGSGKYARWAHYERFEVSGWTASKGKKAAEFATWSPGDPVNISREEYLPCDPRGDYEGESGLCLPESCTDMTNRACREAWGTLNLHHGNSMVQAFNYDCVLATCLLCLALLVGVTLLATGSPNVFVRAGDGYQHRTVMRSYLYWVRFTLFFVIVFSIGGIAFFFQIIKSMVYIKFTDTRIVGDPDGGWDAWVQGGADSPYGFTNTAMILLCFLPMAFLGVLIGMGQRAAYQYPRRPAIDLDEFKGLHQAHRNREAEKLVQFLHNICGLTFQGDQTVSKPGCCSCFSATGQTAGETWCHKHGPEFCRDKADKYRVKGDDEYATHVYLSAASGLQSYDAEVIADALIDAGIDNVAQLFRLVVIDKERLLDIPGISLGAALIIAERVMFFTSPDPKDEPETVRPKIAPENAWAACEKVFNLIQTQARDQQPGPASL